MSKKKVTNVRVHAARVVYNVVEKGNSLSVALPETLQFIESKKDKSLLQELCYGVVRHYFLLDAIKQKLVLKPLKKKDRDVCALILVGLYQILYMRIPDHAAVSESVNAAIRMEKTWCKSFVNGVLRRFIREKESLLNALKDLEVANTNHPAWMLEVFKKTWPSFWQSIIEANNQYPPMCLRINLLKSNRVRYLSELSQAGIQAEEMPHSNSGIVLQHSVDTDCLPGFESGIVSVQDGAAQLVAPLLDITTQNVVLDLCAAPGGKTCHLLEMQNPLFMVACDVDLKRIRKVADNLQRLNLQASLVCGDGLHLSHWCRKSIFDRILLDAPCSGSGVIRRHPDIKLLRRESDITQFTSTQLGLLCQAWQVLKKGGLLLYTTCSIFPQENWLLIEAFLNLHHDVEIINIDADWGHACQYGRQILPGEHGMDGFYFAKLRKV